MKNKYQMEEEEKDDKILKMEAKMYAPLEWDSPVYCKIQDLHESLYEEACRLIKHHYFRQEPMCRAILLMKDKVSVNYYLDLIRMWMNDTTSLVALSAASGRVIGVAVTRINDDSEKSNTFSRNQEIKGRALKKILDLINAVIKQANTYAHLRHNVYFRIYILCVHPSYQEKSDVEYALLRASVHAAKTMKLPAIGGIFTSGRSQSLAEKIGFSIISEIRYNRWVVNERVIFEDPGKGNYSAALMGKIIDYNNLNDKHKDDV